MQTKDEIILSRAKFPSVIIGQFTQEMRELSFPQYKVTIRYHSRSYDYKLTPCKIIQTMDLS